MPVVIVDTEQAALIEAALVMYEAALTARVERADPEQVISKALQLQAYKLATVRTLLKSPEPPAWSDLSPTMRKKAEDLLWGLHTGQVLLDKDPLWSLLRSVINAPGEPN